MEDQPRQSFNDRGEDSNTRILGVRGFPREPKNFGVSERNTRGGEILRPREKKSGERREKRKNKREEK